jgi:hypothetical protein
MHMAEILQPVFGAILTTPGLEVSERPTDGPLRRLVCSTPSGKSNGSRFKSLTTLRAGPSAAGSIEHVFYTRASYGST